MNRKHYTFEGVPHAMRMAMEKTINRGSTPEEVRLEIQTKENKKHQEKKELEPLE